MNFTWSSMFLLLLTLPGNELLADEPPALDINNTAIWHGTKATERTEGMVLGWLKDHQLNDGGWSFTNAGGKPFADPGTSISRVDATSLALLPFLSSGMDHVSKGPYRQTVKAGLEFLLAQAKSNENRLDLRGAQGDMVAHCRAAIVLCDLYALSSDAKIAPHAQAAIRYLEQVQDAKTGGWGLQPGEPADVAVTVWATMLLTNNVESLHVSPRSIQGVKRFLDGVQQDRGAFFGRRAPGKDPLATACGLHSLHLLGWTAENPPSNGQTTLPAMGKGAAFLLHEGLNPKDCTYNFFALDVLYDSNQGEELRKAFRKQLVERIQREGPDRGSWFSPQDVKSKDGGRLYQTVMNALCLDVWRSYRFRLYAPVK